MSKIPIDKNGKSRALELRGLYANNRPKIKSFEAVDTVDVEKQNKIPDLSRNAELHFKSNIKEHSTQNKAYATLIPKMSLNLEKVVQQNPRILDLREKLNAITKKQDRNVDKKTKGLINDITQLVDEKDQDESGPYSLLFDLQPESSASSHVNSETNVWERPNSGGNSEQNFQSTINKVAKSLNKSADRLPNVLSFEDRTMKEFEYSCESETKLTAKQAFNTHSRSDLCLQLKSHVINTRTCEANLSPSENSFSKNNEENSLDDSLGILTPDQMDDICYLENSFSPTVEGLPNFCDNNESKISPDNGDTPSTDKTESTSAASTIQNDGYECAESKRSMFNLPLVPIVSLKEITCGETNSTTCFGVSTESGYPPTISVSAEMNTSPPLIEENTQNNESKGLHKEECDPVFIEEEFMPSIHSSILEPISSIAENIINLEIPLTNRIDQTPSPEDLPLDSSDMNGEISTYSQFSASTLHDSHTFSDSKTDYTKSMETSKVSNSFITSITSITSLDGYQGDGEMSRPVSRGADHSLEQREDAIEMDWQNVPVARRVDPMTDSDFFTESDADGLDDHMQRGDRRAQVIDGALYGGKNANGNPPLIVNRNDDSCMESSGVYTDFENHRSSPVFLNVIDDMSPEGSTPSTRSECSQKNASTGNINAFFSPLEDVNETNIVMTPANIDQHSSKNSSKRNSINSEKDGRSNEKIKEEKRCFTLKKYKMPKRDVPSKLKSMLASRKTEADASVQSSPKTVKKTDRRENLAKKNCSDIKSDFKTKSYKDIKSKVDCSFSLQRSQTSCSVNRMLSSKSTNMNPKPKSRHMRMRMDLGSANGSGKSSLHSSQSDISAISTPLGKHSTGRSPLLNVHNIDQPTNQEYPTDLEIDEYCSKNRPLPTKPPFFLPLDDTQISQIINTLSCPSELNSELNSLTCTPKSTLSFSDVNFVASPSAIYINKSAAIPEISNIEEYFEKLERQIEKAEQSPKQDQNNVLCVQAQISAPETKKCINLRETTTTSHSAYEKPEQYKEKIFYANYIPPEQQKTIDYREEKNDSLFEIIDDNQNIMLVSNDTSPSILPMADNIISKEIESQYQQVLEDVEIEVISEETEEEIVYQQNVNGDTEELEAGSVYIKAKTVAEGIETPSIETDTETIAEEIDAECDETDAEAGILDAAEENIETNSESEAVIEEKSDLSSIKTRKRKRNEGKWKDNKNKILKNSGQKYVSVRSHKTREGKKIGVVCSCKRKCSEKINIATRKKIFNLYWRIGDHEKQWQWILRHVTSNTIKKMQLERKSNRTQTLFYKLPSNEEMSSEEIVCKKMFLNTLGISDRVVYTAIDKQNSVVTDLRGKHENRPRKIKELTENSVIRHIQEFPAIESHYTRKRSAKVYLSEELNISKMYRLYKTWFSAKDEFMECTIASKHQYEMIFNTKFNISFFRPKKDQCERCSIYKNADEERKLELKDNYDRHLKEKDEVRKVKNLEKCATDSTRETVACFDLEKVLYIPQSEVSAFYYKRKFAIYNFTVYDLIRKKGYCLLKVAYSSPIPVSVPLHKDLLSLCTSGAIPEIYQGFYRNLVVRNQCNNAQVETDEGDDEND